MATTTTQLEQLARLRDIASKIKYRDWAVHVKESETGNVSIQIEARVIDTVNGQPVGNFGPSHRVAPNMEDHAVIGLIFHAIKETEMHEVAENFYFDGMKLFDPHICFAFADADFEAISHLKAQARNDNGCDLFSNDVLHKGPFDGDRSEYFRKRLRRRIENSYLTAVYLSENTSHSDWVKWQVEKSIELGRRVIAIYTGDKIPEPRPDFLDRLGIRIVRWSEIGDEIGRP
jgi:Thoeris protein ThsB, TIR-like domain